MAPKNGFIDLDKYPYRKKGKRDVDNGDGVSVALRDVRGDALLEILQENGMAHRVADIHHLNPGQIRMAVGQMLREAIRHDRAVTVRGAKVVL